MMGEKRDGTSEGEILHIHKGKAWVLWRASMGVYDDAVFPIARLGRLS